MSVEDTQTKVAAAPEDHAAAAPAAPGEAPAAHGHTSLPVLQRLKQHHIGRVALLYLGVSWIILEPVRVFFHMLGVPDWANWVSLLAPVRSGKTTPIPA